MAGRCRVGTDSFSLREKSLHARQGVHVDIVIVAVVSGLAIVMHVVLYVLFRRWMDRDLALSFAGDDEAKRRQREGCRESRDVGDPVDEEINHLVPWRMRRMR